MTHRKTFVVCFAWMCVLLAPGPARAAASSPSPAAAAKESPFACAVSAFTPAVRKQHFDEYGPRLRSALRGVRELQDGYEFQFDTTPDTYKVLAAWTFQERLCCPFFDLELRIDREGGPTWLRLTGREGVKEFIVAEFEPWFQKLNAR